MPGVGDTAGDDHLGEVPLSGELTPHEAMDAAPPWCIAPRYVAPCAVPTEKASRVKRRLPGLLGEHDEPTRLGE